MYRIIIILSVFLGVSLGSHEDYDGHVLYEVEPENIDQVQELHKLEAQYLLDVWSHAVPGCPGHILVANDLQNEFQNALHSSGIKYRVKVANIKEALDLEDKLLAEAEATSNRTGPGLSFDVIHRYAEVDAYLVRLAEQYPNLVTTVSGGRSFEGRDIKYVKISTTNFQDRRKPVVMLQALIHAREWVSLPVALYAIHKLVIDVTEHDLVRDIDWIILPIVNPDGYEHSHIGTAAGRIWRKNRATGYMDGNFCLGVDLNRNFDTFWGVAGSPLVCAETFRGGGPFSEPETRVVRDIILQHVDRLQLYCDLHSYGSAILYGYGIGSLAPNALMMQVVGVNMAQAIDAAKWPTNRNYIVGNIVPVMGYLASGMAGDYGIAMGIPFPFTIELPPYNNNFNNFDGFLVDPAFIEQAGYETWEGIKVAARHVRDNFRP